MASPHESNDQPLTAAAHASPSAEDDAAASTSADGVASGAQDSGKKAGEAGAKAEKKPAKRDVTVTGVHPPRDPPPAASLARIVLAVIGMVWLLLGVFGLVDPRMLADIVDLRIDSPLGRLEVRAMYGGFGVAMGLLHLLAASRKAWLAQGLFVTGVLTTGLLSGRVLTVAMEGTPGPTGLLLIGSEASMITVVAVAWWRLMVAARAQKKLEKKAVKAAAKAKK